MLKKNLKIKVSNFKICLTESDIDFILDKERGVLKSSRWTSGPVAKQFEDVFKKYAGTAHAIAVSNAGTGIAALLQALKIPEDSIVICPTLTAPPTPHSILLAGMRVVFADSNSDDLGLNPQDVEEKLERYRGKVKAVITVHLGGWISPRIHELSRLCKKYGVYLIEDCAHAHGSFLNSKHAGSTGKAAVYSFFMTKSLNCGEGGLVTSEDSRIIERIRVIRNYGKNDSGIHVVNGFNYKFSEINAAVALWAAVNAKRIIGERRRLAAKYDLLLKGIRGISIVNVQGCLCGYYKYIIKLDNGISRDAFKRELLLRYAVEPAGGVYDLLCHQEPYFKSIPNRILNVSGKFPAAEDFSDRQVCLPLYPGLKAHEQEYIADSIRKLMGKV
ncbi:MAG: DegT/DnrJ/EryC1/StrS aminotransferase family protein [Candidatus Omnitrophica bacterium]|nr:DegT/DnrJ/EryC1/StrS aminotransferase family protein [Candidatus Omnitrophota bacterium]